MSSDDLANDHWVSLGYQQNFATDDHRVAVLDVRSGEIVDGGRPIGSNFSEPGFRALLEQDVPADVLERALAPIEPRVIEEIRTIHSGNRGPQQEADVVRLFAAHLVRSPSFRTFHADGDDPVQLVEAMSAQLGVITDLLERFHLQIVELDEGLPGFALGDTPVLHIATRDHRFGFRDDLAVGDADLIAGPLTRTTAACFTVEPLPDVRFGTRKRVDTWNAFFIRAAQAEVVCHPDDARGLRQTHSRLDRLPPSLLIG